MELNVNSIQWDVTDGAEETTPEEDAEVLATLPKEIIITDDSIDFGEYGVTEDTTIEEICANDELMDAIGDLISDKYGFCHAGFCVDMQTH